MVWPAEATRHSTQNSVCPWRANFKLHILWSEGDVIKTMTALEQKGAPEPAPRWQSQPPSSNAVWWGLESSRLAQEVEPAWGHAGASQGMQQVKLLLSRTLPQEQAEGRLRAT